MKYSEILLGYLDVYFSVIRIEVLMAVKTVHLKDLSKTNLPDCFQFDITVRICSQIIADYYFVIVLWSSDNLWTCVI